MNEIINVPMSGQRDLATVTAEIRAYQDAARRAVLSYCIEIGRRLVEAKSMVPFGEWGNYLKDELGFSQSTANNHMRLFEAYGAEQMTLTGAAVKSQAFADLSYTQALALLALPSEEEREAFVEANDLASMSTRELREELRKREPEDGPNREELAKRLDDAMEELRTAEMDREKAEAGEDKEFQRANALKIERDQIRDQLTTAQNERNKAQAAAQAAAAELAKAKDELEKARKAEADAVEKLKAAKSNPTVPKETMDKLRQEAEEAAEKRHKADYEDLDQARANLTKAEAEAARARQEAERLEKELRLASPKVAVFRDRFASLQADLSALISSIGELPEDKQEGAKKGLRTILRNCLGMLEEAQE